MDSVDMWVQVLRTVSGDNDGDNSYADLSTMEQNICVDDDDDSNDKIDDPYKILPFNLLPLPEINQLNYTQEDANYFCTKK